MTRILIVDDDERSLYALGVLLSGRGYEVAEARHGAEALAQARLAPPQLIVSDLLMPVMDGYTLLRHWKADARLRAIPFVIYTATYTEPQDEKLALDLGADAFVIKPADPEALIASIEEMLAKATHGDLLAHHAPSVQKAAVLKEYSEVLVHKLEEKTRELEQANRALEQDIAERKQAEERLSQRTQEMALLNKVGYLVSSSLSLDHVVHAAIDGIAEALGPDLILFFLRQNGSLQLQAMGPSGSRFKHDDTPIHRVGECLCGSAAQDGEPIYSFDICNDPRCTWEECKKAGLRSFAALPLKHEHTVIAVLGLASGTPRDFAKRAPFLETLAAEIAVGLQNSLLLQEIRKRSAELEQEVAERKLAQAAQRELQARLHEIVEQAPYGIQVFALNGSLIHVNEAWQGLWQLPRSALEGYNLLHDEQLRAAGLMPLIERAFAGEAVALPEILYDPGRHNQPGPPRWVDAFLYPLRDHHGHISEAVLVTRDITDRKRAEEALRLSEERFATLFRSSPDAITLTSLASGRIVEANESASRLTGYSHDELIGHSSKELNLWANPADRDRYTALLLSDRRVTDFEADFRTKSGELRAGLISGELISFPDGQYILGVIRDVTERKRAAEALRESEERYRVIAELISDYAYQFRVDADGVPVNEWVTESFMRVVGLPLGEMRARGGWSRFIHADDWPVVRQHIARVVSTGDDVCEFRFVTIAGESRWVRNYARLAREPTAGAPARIYGAAQDLTERKRAEAALRENEERLARIVETTPDAIVILDRNGRISFANPAAEQIMGLSRSTIATRVYNDPAWAVTTVDGQPFPDEELPFSRVMRSGQSAYGIEQVIAHPDGRHVVLSVNAAPLYDAAGTVVGMVAAFTDITERKRAEAALRKKEHLLSESQRVARIGSWGWDLTGPIEWTDETYRVYGVSPETFTPTIESLVNLLHPEDRAAMQRWIEACAAGQSPDDIEFRAILPDGSIRLLSGRGELIGATENRPAFMAGTVQDITERKQAEEERERLQAALRRSETMAAIGGVVAGVAHEVRNPLFAITASLDAFEPRLAKHEEYQRFLAVLRSESNRLRDLMRDLLDYGRPHVLELAPGHIGAVIAEAAAVCAPLAQQAGVHIATGGTHRMELPVMMDRGRLCQVFQNLLQNALQLSARGTTVTVDMHAVEQDGAVWLECAVADCGPGFPETDLPRIFEPFFSRRKGGTGLGLSIVQRIVEEHGGSVRAANRPEGGAVVTVRLPLAG
ncbi:MAG: PAS domain S-box protein [Deltaproteobacteria bacterium]|nr:PAS domain S-box protein [Deltaproteobacteria bacterium]